MGYSIIETVIKDVIKVLYAKLGQDGIEEYPLSERDIKNRMLNTSFPSPFAPPDGYVEVADIMAPSCGLDEIAIEGTPILKDGVWSRSWSVEKASPDVVNDRKIEQAKRVREVRNEKLAKSDWTQLADSQVDSQSWAVYRQSLRDITSQSGFPFAVSWPAEPAQ